MDAFWQRFDRRFGANRSCAPDGRHEPGLLDRSADGDADPDVLDLATDRKPFESFVWPTLAHRVPAFDRLRLLDTWAGHYEVNTLDANAIIGPHPVITNLLFANGFSGHGLQQAPAVGRGLAEWIATGGYETLDLRPLGYDRIIRGEPLRELNIV